MSTRRSAGPEATSVSVMMIAGLGSACLLAWAQPPSGFAWLGVVGAVPWLWAIARRGALFAIGLSFVFGTSYGCLVSLWIPEALGALHSSMPTALSGWILTAAWAEGLPLTAVGLAIWTLRRTRPTVQVFGTAAVFYGCAFVVSSWRFGVPWASLGYSQVELPGVAQLAVAGGVPLLSAWLGSINAAIALAIGGSRAARRLATALAISWLATASIGLTVAERVRPPAPQGAAIRLLIVQPDLPRYTRWDSRAQPWILETVAGYTANALAGQPGRIDAIVWPENLLTTPLAARTALASALQAQVDHWGVPLIAGFVRSPSGQGRRDYRSSVLWIEPGRGVLAAVDKYHAVPLLESSRAILGEGLLAPLFGRAARWPKVEEAATAGTPLVGRFSVTPALCYEVLYAGIVAERRSPESRAILNLADDSWVKGDTATRQLAARAAFRAIEQRLTLIRVAHGGLSTVIDPFGRTLTRLPLDQSAHEVVRVEPSAPPSVPEKMALIALPLLVGLGVWWALKRRSWRGME